MFENIEQLEQQVAEFQKNILASSSLVNNIKELTSTIKNQQDEYLRKLNEVLVQVEQEQKFTTDQIERMLIGMDHRAEATLLDLGETNNNLINRIQQNFTGFNKQLIDSLEKSELDIKTISENALNSHREINQEYIERLQDTSTHVTIMKEQLDLQFSQFFDRLESTSISQLIEHVNNLDKLIKIKFSILIIGISISAILILLLLLIP